MQQNDNYEILNIEDFNLLVKWYEYSHYLKTIIAKNKFSSQKEYYCINLTWVNNFKKLFNYDEIKLQIFNYKNTRIDPLNEGEINDLYSKLQCNISISQNEKKIIKNIDNRDIYKNIQNSSLKTKYNINCYYDNFVILDKNMLDELKRYQYNMLEEPKCNFVIGKSIFIQSISNEVIEVGIFGENKIDIYNYELLLLIKYEDKKDKDLEIGKIKGINDYLNKFYFIKGIKEKNLHGLIINKENGKKAIIINLKYINEDNIDIIGAQENVYDISTKKGLVNIDQKTSGMNSIIQILTSIEDLIEYLTKENKDIESFNHIYILSSFLLKFIYKLYSKKDNKKKKINDDNLEKQMKIIINFINPEINGQSIDKFFLFFLNTLHDELNKSEEKKKNLILLESFPSPINIDKKFSYSKFENYYKLYFNSKISDLFNWICEKKHTCSQCNIVFFNYQAFPFLEFDLDKVHEYINTNNTKYKQNIEQYQGNQALIEQKKKEYLNERINQPIHIENCFSYLSNYNNISNMNCANCNNKVTQFNINCYIHKSPKYFIIVLNRKQPIRCQFDVKLDLQHYGEESCEYVLYELMAVLINQKNNSQNHYFTFIKKDENEWMRFNDNVVDKINIREVLKNYQLESRILIYKGVKNN